MTLKLAATVLFLAHLQQLLHTSCFAVDTIRTVALSDTNAVGLPACVRFDQFGTPALNSIGQVAFWSSLAGQGVNQTNLVGVWSEASGSLQHIARSGAQIPDLPQGVNIGEIGSVTYINSNGSTLFASALTGNVTSNLNDFAVLSGDTQGLKTIVRSGDNAPGVPVGHKFAKPIQLAMSSNGQLAIFAKLTGAGVTTSTDEGIWTGNGVDLLLLVREGDSAPGTPAGIEFGSALFSTTFATPTMNRFGQSAFFALLAGPAVDQSNDRGIWAGDTDELHLIARAGQQAAGVPAGLLYRNFASGDPAFNSAGDVAFWADLDGPGSDDSNRSGIWVSNFTGSNVKLIARGGQPAPGLPAGATFVSLVNPSLNSAGRTAFVGRVSGGGYFQQNGVWSEGFGTLDVIAMAGDHAPGTPGGVAFDIFFTSPVINSVGQCAFHGVLTGTGINNSNDRGIWAQSVNGDLQLIAREGDLLEVATNDFRKITQLNFLFGDGTDEGRLTGFNDQGLLAFRALFEDGSEGIFVSRLGAVPEPSGALLAVCAVVLGVPLQRRPRSNIEPAYS